MNPFHVGTNGPELFVPVGKVSGDHMIDRFKRRIIRWLFPHHNNDIIALTERQPDGSLRIVHTVNADVVGGKLQPSSKAEMARFSRLMDEWKRSHG